MRSTHHKNRYGHLDSIPSIFSLAISIPHQLIDTRGGVLTGTDEHVALELVTKAKEVIVDSGLLYKDFSMAPGILDRRKNLFRCTTGSVELNSFLKGGIEIQAITEIAGEFCNGKSQICYTLLLMLRPIIQHYAAKTHQCGVGCINTELPVKRILYYE